MPNKEQGGIYKITNTATGDFYIGQSKDLRTRIYSHKNYLERGKHHNQRLQADWTEYGNSNFVFETIETVENPADLLGREDYHIRKTSPSYNITKADRQFTFVGASLSTADREALERYCTRHSISTSDAVRAAIKKLLIDA